MGDSVISRRVGSRRCHRRRRTRLWDRPRRGPLCKEVEACSQTPEPVSRPNRVLLVGTFAAICDYVPILAPNVVMPCNVDTLNDLQAGIAGWIPAVGGMEKGRSGRWDV